IPVNDFCDKQKNLKSSILPKKLRYLHQHINHLKNTLNREKNKMKKQRQSDRKLRTRQLIQIGGLVQKSGLMDAFLIAPGDDLQDYENLSKAARLLGFLNACLESNCFDQSNLERWQSVGSRLLKF
ncbi:MAG: conjugal transfer protein TraD, partial [Thermodesulfobium sp.]